MINKWIYPLIAGICVIGVSIAEFFYNNMYISSLSFVIGAGLIYIALYDRKQLRKALKNQ